ncbi:hypothetical protein Tco_1121377 [Tanacetum coccineum]|uniref:Uncharacterized protein n=1 Tax=Tanacetum coccineum TaxID=301880 RepID=A0ABQ5IXI3_9ASTR
MAEGVPGRGTIPGIEAQPFFSLAVVFYLWKLWIEEKNYICKWKIACSSLIIGKTETHLPVFFKTKAHIEQIPPHLSTYQRHRKTQNHRRTKKDTKLPQTSVPQDLKADEDVHKEGVIVWKGLSLLWQSQAQRHHRGAPAQTRSKRVLENPNEPPLSEGYTSGSGEGRMEHQF